MKKRFLSAILIFSMLASMCPVGVLAASKADATGELRLTMHRSSALAETGFTVKLSGSAGELEGTLQAMAETETSILTLRNIADGSYTLTVTAPNYLTYKQEGLVFDGRCVQVDLYNYAHINAGRTSELYGVMPVGDVNTDGKIDDADAQIITDAIGGDDLKYDLSGDGSVDLADLAIAVRNQSTVTLAKPVHIVSSAVLTEVVTAAVDPDTTTTTSESSNPKDLLDQSKHSTVVGLKTRSGEEISETYPVELALTVSDGDAAQVSARALVITPPAGSSNTIAAGTIMVEAVNLDSRKEFTIRADIGSDDVSPTPQMMSRAAPVSGAEVKVENDGTVVIDLGQRVAIKKVTIRVTATANQGNLAEIAKVEFLSDFAERIPEPQLSIPTVLSVTNTESDGLGYKSVTVTWNPQQNVTGYEVRISGPGYNKTAVTSGTSCTFVGDSFNGTVRAFEKYTITVRSTSSDWKSDWSEPYVHTVTCAKTPPAPEYVTAVPGINSLNVSWTCKFDAETFTLYYKHPNDASFTAVKGLTASSCLLQGLEAGVKYTLYVMAHNRNGSSPRSANAEGIPTSPTGVEMPKYKLINVDNAQGKAASHIVSFTGNTSKTVEFYGGEDWSVLTDNDPASYLFIKDWDNGVAYGGFCGPEITLDTEYTFDTIRFAPFEGETISIYGAAISYYNKNSTLVNVSASLSAKQDAQGRKYYEIITQQPITASKFQLRTRTFNTAPITMSEVRIYAYDDLENTVAGLFADNMRTVLKDTVTMEDITALITRAETSIDPVSGEAHPHKDTILTDLEYAKALLENNANAHILTVDTQITASGSPNSGSFAQALSDYQPLGCVAAAGDTVIIYVTDDDDKTARGSNVDLYLVATQYHAQVSAWQSSVTRLKAGRNEITIPKIGSDATERGGSLYLQYTGAKGDKNYTVRVTGGTYIPVLNVDGVTGEARTAAIQTYVNELRDYAAKVETLHGQLHGTDKDNESVKYAYAVNSCFLNATEICMDNMMYSLPATQVWEAIQTDPAGILEKSIAAMEQEIDYFYQFKGLHKDDTGADAYPYTRLNIRYHQMFTGAFMYAGGKHIGIEFGSTGAVLGLTPIVSDDNGKYVSGNLSGWGIAHEIGHCINHPSYQRVEVTNNMFAQLAKTGTGGEEATANFRTTYNNVYAAVATGTTGHTGNLAVQLAMYWQLHLAYDNNYAYKLYDSADEAQEAMFYARLEAYLRDGTKAPKPFTASSSDQLFMQAVCAAAGRNILHFFKAWGFTPDAATEAYATQYPAEERKIQYIDDDSRLYRLEGKPGMSDGTTVTASITNAESSRINGNQVKISLSNTNNNAMLGYEICRNGKMVAFVPATETSYTDIVTTENNKAFTYTVTGIDKLLKETETLTLPQVKVSHDGAIDKSGWSVQTNMTSTKDTVREKNENDPESGMVNGSTLPTQEKVSAITAALDNNENTVYYGAAGSGNNRPYILLALGGVEQVTAVKFTPAKKSYDGDAAEGVDDLNAADLYKYRLFGYKVEISLDGNTWTTVKEGNAYKAGSATNPSSWVAAGDIIFSGDSQGDGSYTLYFNKQLDDGTMDPYMYTYDAAYIRITSTSMSALALAEIDVLGPTSDNVELVSAGFGRLSADYPYGSGKDEFIPAGSVVFYGEYKGDPSYNVVLLKDQNGKVLDGSQIILANVTGSGALGATGDGRWLFWLEDKDKKDSLGDTYNEMDRLRGENRAATVQAELWRVQDAMTLEGQRLTSTSLTMEIPAVIPNVTITSDTSLAAYIPSDDAMTAAAAGERVSAVIEAYDPYLGATALGDTGAARINAVTPIQLTPKGTYITVHFQPAYATDLAAQAVLTLSPAPAAVTVPHATRDGVYQSYKYDRATGTLTLFAVARESGLGETTLSADLTPSASCTVAVDSLSVLSSTYGPSQVEDLPDISVEVSQATAPGGNGGNTDPGDTGNTDPGDTGNTDPGDTGNTDPGDTGNTDPGNTGNGSTSGNSTSDRYDDNDSDGGSNSSKPSTSKPSTTKPAETRPSQPPALPFTDVLAGSWYEEAVRFVYENKMMQGTGDGVFAPDLTTSRAMLVTVLYRLFGSPSVVSTDVFTDVSPDEWYTAAVSWASANGIVSGYDTEHFGPNDPVTRQQMVAILYRYANYCGYDLSATADLSSYADIGDIQAYATNSFVWAVGAGIISGITTETLSPNGNGTRAQIAAILCRFCQRFPVETQG